MANPLYESLHGGNAQNSAQTPYANPLMMARQAGYQIPDEIANDPKSIVTYLIQSGQVSNPMLQRIGPMINQMMGAR